MSLLNIGIIGAGKGGKALLETFREFDINIAGVVDKDLQAPGIKLAQEQGIRCYDNLEELLKNNSLDVIFEVTGDEHFIKQLREKVNSDTTLVDSHATNIMLTIIGDRKELLEVKKVKEQLAVILNSAREGVQVVAKNGIIEYVNQGFTNITGVDPSQRIGHNIFDVSPNGALVEVLNTGKPCIGKRNHVTQSHAEVISNAAPIKVNGEMTGAVVVFQDITDIIRLTEEINGLKEEIKELKQTQGSFDDIATQCPKMQHMIVIAKRAAREDTTILITGESGTGKELFANAIYKESARADKPFIKVNCAAIPENLLESELFGYEPGAFTGAIKLKLGKFELASGGTLLLDEIGDMSPMLQAKLLRVLQEQEIERIGGTKPIKIDTRIISSTNRDLTQLIKEGKFREDLYYRLNVINIHIPPLISRKEDVLLLSQRFIKFFNRKFGKKVMGLTQEAKELMLAYSWPGNVRELMNMLERTLLMTDEEMITAEVLMPYFQQVGEIPLTEPAILPLDEVERQLIERALQHFGTNVEGKQKAADALNISLGTLYNKLRKYKSL